ncbi:MAG: glycoside hydrolase family 3 N-terminal domain-containing protein [Porphyromonas sp.]|nr:glycoside hydrolase family 3 N-terminal domain-containing protein [Porphyromonas sp.]
MNKILWTLQAIFTLAVHVCILPSAQAQTPQAYIPALLSADQEAMHSWVEKQIKDMSLDQQIGQLIMPIIHPQTAPQAIRQAQKMVREIGIGGILYQKGYLLEQYLMNTHLQSSASVPLLIALDGEYGLWMRLKDALRYPRAMALGHIQDKRYIYWYGRELASQCKQMGIHVNFAPVLDINNNPNNPVIGTRSFGVSVDEVLTNALVFSAGLEDGGVLSVGKHFPGHGNTNVDSHKALPNIGGTRQELLATEIVPFNAYIQMGFGGMMIGHLQVPALEPEPHTPASMSATIVEGLLNGELGFRGLIFTDAMEMQGMQISGNDPISVRALQAGVHVLLGPTNPEIVLREIKAAVASGKLSKKQIEKSCRKVLSYKYALIVKPGIPRVHLSQDIPNIINTPQAKTFSRQLWRQSIKVKYGNNELPIDLSDRVALLQLGTNKPNRLSVELKRAGIKTQIHYAAGSSINISGLLDQLKQSRTVIVSICTSDPSNFGAVIDRLLQSKRVILCFLTTPFAEQKLRSKTRPNALLHAFEYCEESMSALADRLTSPPTTYVLQLSAEDEYLYQKALSKIETVQHAIDEEQRDLSLPKSTSHSIEGKDKELHKRISTIVREGIEAKAFPGCQVLALYKGEYIYEGCFGRQTYNEQSPAISSNTIYDLASVTKAAATTPATMLLIDRGRLSLSTKVEDILPRFRGTAVGSLRLEELLLHSSGLVPGLNFYEELIDKESLRGKLLSHSYQPNYVQLDRKTWGNPHFSFQPLWISPTPIGNFNKQFCASLWINKEFKYRMLELIAALKLQNRGDYRYSDLNFLLIQQILETLCHQGLDQFVEENIYRPIESNLCFTPLLKPRRLDDIAPSQNDLFLRKETLQGTVNDETAACLGGISGNAGLFGTARDLAKLLLLYRSQGIHQGKQLITQKTFRRFISTTDLAHRRYLGFDKQLPKELNYIAPSASKETYGHTGFTGTCFWIDPRHDLIFIFLSNRTYPSRTHTNLINLNIRKRLHQVFYEALGIQ